MRPLLRALAVSWLPLLGVCTTSGALAAETGDYDGDGRLTIADVLHAHSGRPAAPGSIEAFQAHPCAASWAADASIEALARGGVVHLESLRRAVRDALPNWLGLWPNAVAPPPPREPSPAVEVSLVAASMTGFPQEVAIELSLACSSPVRAFSIILDVDGRVLQVPAETSLGKRTARTPFDPALEWLMASRYSEQRVRSFTGTVDGEPLVTIGAAPFLITNGRIVATYGLSGPPELAPRELAAGDHSVTLLSHLGLGTRAGMYRVRLLPGSEVLLTSGEVVAPILEGDVEVVVQEDVVDGYDAGVPPLDLDADERRVRGEVAFRISEARGLPGELVRVRVESRTEVPLNDIYYLVSWPSERIECVNWLGGNLVYADPIDGTPYLPYDGNEGYCLPPSAGLHSQHAAHFALAGALPRSRNHESRPLESFRPLGEWVAIADLELRISPDAGGGSTIPLRLRISRESFERVIGSGSRLANQFFPYGSSWPCSDVEPPAGGPTAHWTYDPVRLEDGRVVVLGNAPEGPAPPDTATDPHSRWILTDVDGAPGEVVDVPIFVAADLEPIPWLVLVLETDPTEATIESFAIESLRESTGEFVTLEARRGERVQIRECLVELQPSTCTFGIPGVVDHRDFFDLGPRFAMLEIAPSHPGLEVSAYPGPDLRRIGSVRVRVNPDFAGDALLVRHALLPPDEGPFDEPLGSGARTWDERGILQHVPASETRDGTIRLRGRPTEFLRGDANLDGAVDLSDAVTILGHLFLGTAALRCLDAGDADDGGSVSLTDAIVVLDHLFQGGRGPSPPYPACGDDPTADDIDCSRGDCP